MFLHVLGAYFCLTIHQMDVDTAFLISMLEKSVYVFQPPEFISNIHPN